MEHKFHENTMKLIHHAYFMERIFIGSSWIFHSIEVTMKIMKCNFIGWLDTTYII